MEGRRQFFKKSLGFMACAVILISPLASFVKRAYEVNGEPLPRKHGFPLRIVAEDRYGSEWVKYVYKVTVENKNLTSKKKNP